jgi:Ni/Fe-hydrogenase subunit HybB-like protein
MLYTTVLALELSGMVFEKVGWKRAVRWQQSATIPLVVAGVVLSTLHQSSLGALYLIVPEKLYPLWYSPALPWIFWLSAIAAGLAMVVVESRISSRAFGREIEMHLLSDVARVLVVALGVFAVLRLYDLYVRGALPLVLQMNYEAGMFALEFMMGVVLPFALLLNEKTRTDIRRLYPTALLTVMGFVVNRLNVSVTGLEKSSGANYVPAWSEIAVTLFMVALGFAAFSLAVRYLPVYPEAERPAPAAARQIGAPPARPVPAPAGRAV